MNTVDQISSHLEFLGYKVARPSGKPENIREATHQQKYDFFFFEAKPGIIFFRANLKIERPHSAEMDAMVNKMNDDLTNISSFYLYHTDDKVLAATFRSVYCGNYDKEVFSTFIDEYQMDQARTVGNEEFKKLFI